MFDFSTSPLPVTHDRAEAFRYVWRRLARPGTWWTGQERVAIAATARTVYESGHATAHTELPAAATGAAALLSHNPAAVSQAHIADWEDGGLTPSHYVELVGIVAQITAIDTFHRALDLDLEPLPEPEPGEPSAELPSTPATVTKAWVPMVGPPTIPTSLSAVPAEMEALEALHGPMYLTYEEMGDPAVTHGLTRAQMELVASRTSAINECFF
jgi:alkylhydroperoxidase family enzyme